jgi:hypothetical protein
MWEESRKGIIELMLLEKDRATDWQKAIERKAFFGRGSRHLKDALELFALEENELAESKLDYTLRCLEKAEEIDDCYYYGERFESVKEEIINGRSFTSYCYTPAAEDGVEPWHDEDLGRALRVRMLFTARWLKTGERDQALLLKTINHLKDWLDMSYALPPDSAQAKRTGNTTGSFIKRFVQWCVEAKEYELGKEYCKKEAGRPLTGTPEGWKFIERLETVFYLLAVHESGERDLSQLFPEALDRYYKWHCRKIGSGYITFHADEDFLGIAYMRAERMGLGTEARELLRRIREDS